MGFSGCSDFQILGFCSPPSLLPSQFPDFARECGGIFHQILAKTREKRSVDPPKPPNPLGSVIIPGRILSQPSLAADPASPDCPRDVRMSSKPASFSFPGWFWDPARDQLLDGAFQGIFSSSGKIPGADFCARIGGFAAGSARTGAGRGGEGLDFGILSSLFPCPTWFFWDLCGFVIPRRTSRII